MMSACCRRASWAFGLAWFAALALPSFANAASWLGYKNDTASPVVIQSAIIVNNQLRWQKPHSLFPGEVAWDAIAAPGPRIIGVFDPKRNNQLIYQEGVTIGVADIFLSLQMVVPPAPRGQPPQPAQPKFIVTKPPSNPPGTGPQRPPQNPPGSPTNPGAPSNPKPPASPPPTTPPGKSG
jgi:hypothetical protein